MIDNQPVQLTADMKPDLEWCKKRIEKRGGYISEHDCPRSEPSGLSCAGSFGDKSPANVDVCVEPKITMVDLAQLRMKYPEAKLALVQACDGYWDVASDQDTGVTIKRLQDEGKGYEEIAKALVSYALAAKSGDNISLTIVPLY